MIIKMFVFHKKNMNEKDSDKIMNWSNPTGNILNVK